jgi:hypothetical protein
MYFLKNFFFGQLWYGKCYFIKEFAIIIIIIKIYFNYTRLMKLINAIIIFWTPSLLFLFYSASKARKVHKSANFICPPNGLLGRS